MEIIVKHSRNCDEIILGDRSEDVLIKALTAFVYPKFSMGTKADRDHAQYLLNDVFNMPRIKVGEDA
jgi:hypothetical protein